MQPLDLTAIIVQALIAAGLIIPAWLQHRSRGGNTTVPRSRRRKKKLPADAERRDEP